MPRPKSRQVGTAGLVTRSRIGEVRRGWRRCGDWLTAGSWRDGVRDARAHAAGHQRADARYIGAPHSGRRNLRELELRRLAAACGVLVLAVLAFAITMASIAPWAGSTPPTTTTPAPYEYTPVPAGSPPRLPAGGER